MRPLMTRMTLTKQGHDRRWLNNWQCGQIRSSSDFAMLTTGRALQRVSC